MDSDRQESMLMQERARKRIPGMTHLLSKRPDQFSMGVWPGYYSKAAGATIWDLDGNEYLDMSIGGIGATILGYADPTVDGAVCRAIRDGVACSLNCPEEVILAERLCELHPWADKVRLARSGGEAMAVAVRIARAATGRHKVAFCGYHGWHDWYLAANLGGDHLNGHLLTGLDPAGVCPGLEGTALPFRYNHPKELECIVDAYGHELAAVVMEPIRNQAPEPYFLQAVRELTDRAGAVLIFDEISVGFRMTLGGAHLELSDVRPDMAAFAKALGNGYAIAAVAGKDEVMGGAQKTFISSTNWTERVGPVAALATIEELDRIRPFARMAELGSLVRESWEHGAAEHGVEIHTAGIDPMCHFTFDREHPAAKALFVQEMLGQGILASNLFYATAAHTRDHVERYARATDRSFGRIAKAMEKGTLEKELAGKPAAATFARLA